MVLESLAGGILGGVLRIAPEMLKFFDRKGERAHELAMMQAEMEFAKVKGEINMKQIEAAISVAELDTMAEAIKEQSATSVAAGKFVAALSALVRPLITYFFVTVYALVKYASFQIAIMQGGEWKTVLIEHWGEQDVQIFVMILTFWFVGRVWERAKQ